MPPDDEHAEEMTESSESAETTTTAMEVVAELAEAVNQTIEAVQDGHGGIAVARAVGGAAEVSASIVEAAAGDSEEARTAATILEGIAAAAEALIEGEEALRRLNGHGEQEEHEEPEAQASEEALTDEDGDEESEAETSGERERVQKSSGADFDAPIERAMDATDEDREILLEIESPADPDRVLRVAAIELEEKLGDVYRARVRVASELRWNEAPAVAASDLLGADVTLSILRGGAVRTLHGIVRRVEEHGTSSTHLNMELEVVPAMALLSQQVDSRVFFQLSALDVVDAVLGGGLAPYDREIEVSGLIERDPREYCVQYQESDLDFVHRLLEEEGLTYFFDHSGEHEKVVIIETNEQFPGLRGDHQDYLRITDGAHGRAEHDAITEMREVRRVMPTSVSIVDHDWRQSRTRPISIAPEDSQDDRGRSRAVYDHGRALDLGAEPGRHDGERQVRLRRELLTRDAVVGMGRSTAIGLSSGLAFTTLDERELAPLQGRTWITTLVRHRATDPRFHATHGAEEGGDVRYENRFECIPTDTPFRPTRRTPKPRIYGMQTGVVVGPEGQPIFSDAHRRIRVRFHWDRYRPNDTFETQDQDRHTCWVRVSQSWAGFGYGTLFLPRVGMEVVVSFLDGDPDRPVVVGCVYNGENPPPYQKEEEWTVSTMKTLTVDGSDLGPGFNELRFEDKKGSEQVFVHAERDLDEVVEHDHSTRVKRNQSNTVDGDQTERIGGDQSMTVRGNRTATVEKNEIVTIKKNQELTVEKNLSEFILENQSSNIGGIRNTYVDKEDNSEFNGGRRALVREFDNTHVEANKNTTVDAQYNIKADEHFHLEQGQQTMHLGESQVSIESDGLIILRRPGATVYLAEDRIEVSTEGALVLRGGGCSLTMQDGRVLISAESESKMRAGESSFVKVGNTYAEMSADNVSLDAAQIASIQAQTLVRIN